MTVVVRAIGFGTDRPACFSDTDHCSLEITEPLTPRQLLEKIGLKRAVDTIVLINNTTVSNHQWDQPSVCDGCQVTVMAAIEGG